MVILGSGAVSYERGTPVTQVLDPDGVWPASFRPYHELADYIISLS